MFRFKQFSIQQGKAAFKVGTDGILFGAWAEVSSCSYILDIGTGTGLLALMMAQKQPLAQIDAVEVDNESAQQAAENAASSPFSNQISVFHESITQFSPPNNRQYDLIVCNPPYFELADGTLSAAPSKQGARHTILLSHEMLLHSVARLLGENGRFQTIIPFAQVTKFKTLANIQNLFCTKVTAVRPKPSKPPHRALLQFERHPKQCLHSELIIETATHHIYTDDFYELTKAFYLNRQYRN